ncbi:MAG: AAA family ATPase [Chloroflexota bacterium]|nr:AAA family ATPase [Chloroflexota bacterium]
MRHTAFMVKNFKGINSINLDLNDKPRSRIITLVGLNESGKTTILEALNFFNYKYIGGKPETLEPLDLPGYSIQDVHDLIPIGKRSNFNEKVEILARFELDDEDESECAQFAFDTLGYSIEPIKSLLLNQTYEFEASNIKPNQPRTGYVMSAKGRSKGGRVVKNLSESDQLKILNFMKMRLPSVLYFPNFLFEFPDRIYLEDPPEDVEKDEFYRGILQDVLDAIGEGTNLQEHVLARAKDGSPNAKRSLNSVLLGMGRHMSSIIFKNWDRIFKRPMSGKEIVIDCERDTSGLWYLQIQIKEPNGVFAISERSLGFRWFFAFLLLTHYRASRKDALKDVLFLLDEPASNLHPSAQSQLLESFGNLPENMSIIYTTHSHHMINPAWLEGTFVVRNQGIDYSDEDAYIARNTEVTAEKYRSFAANHPDQSTYFKPVLDVLDYSPGKLENVPNVLMLEGKNDFYTIKYFQEKIVSPHVYVNAMPGGGAGHLDTAIRLYLAWGRNFVVLLDSDNEGNAQKQRYVKLFGPVVNDKIFCFADIDTSWAKKGMEYILEPDDRMAIQRASFPDAKRFHKDSFNRAVQELYLTDKRIPLSQATIDNFSRILAFCSSKLS